MIAPVWSAAADAPVLLATEGLARTDSACAVACTLCNLLEAPLVVIAVHEPLRAVADRWRSTPRVRAVPLDVGRKLVERAWSQLRRIAGGRVPWTLWVVDGTPSHAIVEQAIAMNARMIVLGTGARGIEHRLLGRRTAEHVARHAPMPVMAVAPGARPTFARALAGVDFGRAGLRAALAARELLGGSAELVLAYVRTGWDVISGARSESRGAVRRSIEALFDLCQARVTRNGERPPRRLVLRGRPAHALARAARLASADFVAIGRQDLTWAERLPVGSVGEGLIATAPCSVLVVPLPPAPATSAGAPVEELAAGV